MPTLDQYVMRVTEAKWNPMEGYTNSPRMEASFENVPDSDAVRFIKVPIGTSYLYVGEKDGLVRFFSYSGEGNDGGFGGACYDITMTDGTEETLRGPYSSREGIVNKYTDYTAVKVYTIEGSGSRFVSKEVAEEVAGLAGRELVRTTKFDDEIYYRFQ